MASACIRRLGSLPLLLALAFSAAPAAAETPPVPEPAASRWTLPPANLTKRAALLGGESRMQQLLVEQRAPILAATAATAAYTAPSLAGPRPADIVPANGAPNVFGTIALPISATPLDAQWRRATAAPAHQLAGWTGAFPAANGNREALLRQVNAWVNRRLAFTDDIRLTGQADRWAGAAESLRRGRGDCEDYALAKMQLLEALGVDANLMYLVIARDLVRRADHAVLVVQLRDRFVVLDNMTDEVLESSTIRDYRPIISYSSAGRWIHGHAEAPAARPFQIASSLAEANAP